MSNNMDKGKGKMYEDDATPAPEQSAPATHRSEPSARTTPQVPVNQSSQPQPELQLVPFAGSSAADGRPISFTEMLNAPDTDDETTPLGGPNVPPFQSSQQPPNVSSYDIRNLDLSYLELVNAPTYDGLAYSDNEGRDRPSTSTRADNANRRGNQPSDPLGSANNGRNNRPAAPFFEVFSEKYLDMMPHYAYAQAVKELNEKRKEVEKMEEYVHAMRKLVNDAKAEQGAQERQAKHYERVTQALSEKIKSLKEAGGIVEEEEPPRYVDPSKVGDAKLDCVVCKRKVARVMMLPCTCLCACVRCDRALETCPMCGEKKERSVEVYFPHPPPPPPE